MTNNNQTYSLLKAVISTSPQLLFYQFNCPYCQRLNTRSKDFKDRFVLCLYKGCHKPIELENIDEIVFKKAG